MKQVAIKSISMRYFKGIVDKTIELDKEGSVIKGMNKVGKSTVVDAVTWILFDRDSLGNTTQSFDIKTRDEDGNTIPGVEHSVRVEFYDGLVLEKKYKERFTGKKDKGVRAPSSHETEYHFNGMSVRKKDYNDKLGEHITNPNFMQMLTRVHYITEEMNWLEVRNLLFELIENIGKEDVYAKEPELEKVEELLDGFTVPEALTREKDRLSRVREELKEIPVRMDTLQDMKKDPVKPDTEMSEEKVKEAIKNASNVELIDESTKEQISELKDERRKVVNDRNKETDEIMAEARAKKQEIMKQTDDLMDQMSKHSEIIRDLNEKVQELTNQKDRLGISKREVQANIEKFENAHPKEMPTLDDDDLVCPTCKQDLPNASELVEEYDQKKEEHEEYVQQFNERKAEKLKELRAKEKELSKQISDFVLQIKNVKDEINQEQVSKNEIQSEINKVHAKTGEIQSRAEEKAKEKKAKWDERISAIDADLESLTTREPTEEDAEREEWIAELEGYLKQYEEYRSRVQRNQEVDAKIAELKDRKKELSDQLETHEFNILLMERYITTESKLIESRINSKFYNVEWRLFEPLVNGGIKETCVPTYNGVAFKEGVNNAHRIIGGIETIKVVGDHLGIHMPVFIDNAESINRIPMELLDGVQVIPLYVTEDPDLIVESLETEVSHVEQ